MLEVKQTRLDEIKAEIFEACYEFYFMSSMVRNISITSTNTIKL